MNNVRGDSALVQGGGKVGDEIGRIFDAHG
jgi:hypothetical protein